MEKNITSRITKGVIITGLLIALDIILQKTYAVVPDSTRYLPRLVVSFAGVLISCIVYSRQSGGNLAFGELFSHGFKTTAVVAFLMALYTFIAIKLIYPAPSAAEMDAAIRSYEQQGNALHEEAKQLAAAAAKNRWIVYVSVSLFVTLVPGLLGSLAGAAITKKNQ